MATGGVISSSSSSAIPAQEMAAVASSRAFTSQEELILRNLHQFYDNEENLQKMLNIITGESPISLRLLDWFVTNYAKANYTIYSVPDPATGEMKRFKVYDNYYMTTHGMRKERFAPFCRGERIHWPYRHGTYIETTLGQMNFFKWAIENRVIEYIEENFAAINQDMTARNTGSRRRNRAGGVEGGGSGGDTTRRRRHELSVNASKSIKKEMVEITVTFV